MSLTASDMAAVRERVKGHPQRIGCNACDWVAHVDPRHGRQTEEKLHSLVCAHCGAEPLHEYPIRGTWPSEYQGCPFEEPQ